MPSQSITRELLTHSLSLRVLVILMTATLSGIISAPAHATGGADASNHVACDPGNCGERAIFPILRGGQKGAPIRAKDGETICVEIRLERNPNPIEIYGYSVTYNAARLTLQSIQRGPLVANFASDCNQSQPGSIACSGFSETFLPSNSSGVMATLCFLVSVPAGVAADSSAITVQGLRDDLVSMSPCCNLLIASNPPKGPCLGAALYLAAPGAQIGAPLAARTGDAFTVAAGIKEITQPIDAFSFILDYDARAMKFTEAQPGNLLASFAEKQCRELAPGKLLCTASGSTAIPAQALGTLFNLSFVSQCTTGDTSRLTLSELAGDLSGAGICNNIFICKACTATECEGAALYVAQAGRKLGESLGEQSGDSLRMEIRVKASPKELGAFGFRVQYDPAKLSFGNVLRGALTRNFITATARQLQPGVVICAGFGTAPILRNTEGALLELRFGLSCSVGDSSVIRITDLSDDVAGFNTCCNYFVCAPCDRDGDLNTDKLLTAGDALCAFEIFLSGGILSANCDAPKFACELVAADVNCDNAITSRDALAIFDRALKSLPPSVCFARPPSSFGKPSHGVTRIQLLNADQNQVSDTLRLRLTALPPQGLAAFGLLLQYPANDLEFLGAVRSAATQAWVALEGRQYLPGLVVLGGFHRELLRANDFETVAELLFLRTGKALDHSSFAVSNLTDDFAGAAFTTNLHGETIMAAPQQFQLYQNYPNPLRVRAGRSETVIRYDLPKAFAQNGGQVEVVIYNIQGQVVRRLFAGTQTAGAHALAWNGRDDAGRQAPTGIYQYRLTAGTYIEQRRMLIVK